MILLLLTGSPLMKLRQFWPFQPPPDHTKCYLTAKSRSQPSIHIYRKSNFFSGNSKSMRGLMKIKKKLGREKILGHKFENGHTSKSNFFSKSSVNWMKKKLLCDMWARNNICQIFFTSTFPKLYQKVHRGLFTYYVIRQRRGGRGVTSGFRTISLSITG